MKFFIVTVSVSLVLAFAEQSFAHFSPEVGKELGIEFGLGGKDLSVGAKTQPAPSPAKSAASGISSELKAKLEEQRELVVELIQTGKHDATIQEMRKFVVLLDPHLKATRDPDWITLGLQAHLELINWLKQFDRHVDALVEANYLQHICLDIYGCDVRHVDALASNSLAQLNRLDDWGLLQIKPGDKGLKKSYFYLLRLLHPDKNIHLAEDILMFRGQILSKVQEAYKYLSGQSL